MCVVIIKKAGVNVPSDEIMKKCFEHNPDGCGFMYWGQKGVVVNKGFMNFNKFKKFHKKVNLKKDNVAIYHFRLASTGRVTAGNTHPFPVTKNIKTMRKLAGVYDLAVAHNGTFRNTPKHGVTDTMQFIRELLANRLVKETLHETGTQNAIEEYIRGSRVAVLTKQGLIHRFGRGWKLDEKTGLVFSNMFWKLEPFKTDGTMFRDEFGYFFNGEYYYTPKRELIKRRRKEAEMNRRLELAYYRNLGTDK